MVEKHTRIIELIQKKELTAIEVILYDENPRLKIRLFFLQND